MANFGVGASLQSLGQDQLKQATQELAESAHEESKRNQQNEIWAQQKKQGNMQLGATTGAMAGMAFGPWGALIGGAVGAIAGGVIQ